MSLRTGLRIGRYEIQALLGRGGMGEVYRASDRELGREVALKFLPADFASDSSRMSRFRREAAVLSALNHPNIMTVDDVGETADGLRFLVAELVGGITLRQRLARGPLPLRDALEIATQLASALVAAHARGVVHRDLKPENVMIRDDGYVKVLDFGLAKRVVLQSSRTQSATAAPADTNPGVVIGTVAYMAPEQARGEEVDARADLWSLGVVLYEMVTGRLPFDGRSPTDTLVAILDRDPPPFAQYVPDAPDALQEVVTDALTKDVDARFQTAKQMSARLRRLTQRLDQAALPSTRDRGNLPVGAPASGSGPLAATSWTVQSSSPTVGVLARLTPPLGRRVALVGVAAVGAAAALWLFAGGWRADPLNSNAPLRITPLTSYPGVERSPAFSPDGRQIAYVSGRLGTFDIFVQLLGAGEPLRLTSTPDWDMSPVWSPDGRYIAFLRGRGAGLGFYVVPALGGVERRISSAFGWRFGGVMTQAIDWLPDGNAIAIVDKASDRDPWSVYLLASDSGERRRVTKPPDGWDGDQFVTVSPDGRSLAFARLREFNSRTGHIYVVPINGGELVRLTSEEINVESLAWSPDGQQLLFPSAAAGGNTSIWTIPAAGGAPAPVNLAGNNARELAVARQGNRLVYAQLTADHNVWRIPLTAADNGTARSGTPERFLASNRMERVPRISPDGQRVSFRSDRSGRDEVWVSDMTGDRVVQVTTIGGTSNAPAAWSPDGRTLAFDSDAGGRTDVYLVNADGGTARALTTDNSREITPSWSHDGRWIYFTSDRTGMPEVWKISASGGNPVRMTHGGGSHPAESADGEFVYFVKNDPANQLWKVPVNGNGPATRAFEGSTPVYATSWVVNKRGIYFFTLLAPGAFALNVQELGTSGVVNELAILKGDVGPHSVSYPSVSPDETWIVYEQRDRLDFDLMLVENFY
jgi:eukaryotic-like serine/threonine-protein kinase